MVELYAYPMQATRLLAENIAALLKRRGYSQADLAQWCRHSAVWVSQFLAGKRNVKVRDLDRMADLLGVPVFQLFQPGISSRTERRAGVDRRQGTERRVTHHARMAAELESRLHPLRKEPIHGSSSPVRQLVAEFEARLNRVVSQAESRGQATAARPPVSGPRPRRRVVGRPDVEET